MSGRGNSDSPDDEKSKQGLGGKMVSAFAFLAMRGVDLPRSGGMSPWSLFGPGLAGIKGVFAGLPGLLFLGSVSVAFWVFLGKTSGVFIYFVIFILWIFIGRVVWLAKDKVKKDRFKLLLSANSKDIEGGIRRQIEESAVEGARSTPRRVRNGQVVSVDRDSGIVRISVLDALTDKGLVQEFPSGFLSETFLKVVRPGVLCRIEDSVVTLNGERFGVTEIVPDVFEGANKHSEENVGV